MILAHGGNITGIEIPERGERARVHVEVDLPADRSVAGSVPRAADLVVSDPVQAGVMAVMAVAKTASFDIARQRGRTY